MTKTIDAIYEKGLLKPKRRLPFREHARLKLTIIFPTTSSVRHTAGIIRVAPRTARDIIYGDEAEFFGA